MSADKDEMMLGYSSSKNVTFRGEVPLGVTRAEWEALSEKERDQVVDEAAAELVDVWVVGE